MNKVFNVVFGMPSVGVDYIEMDNISLDLSTDLKLYLTFDNISIISNIYLELIFEARKG
jgi:hypothetical protein